MKSILKLIILIAILLMGITFHGSAHINKADQIIGCWMTFGNTAKVQIYKLNDKYFGKIIWADEMYEADGKTLKTDSKNENPKMRKRTIKNLELLSNFIYKDDMWTEGTVYDPKNGSTYRCKIKLNGTKLEIRGYIGISLFGRTEIWNKVEE